MLDEQKVYFGIEIFVSFICLVLCVGFGVASKNNELEFTMTAIGISLVYLFMFFFVLNDTVLEDYDVAKKVMVILFYFLSLTVIALLPVLAKVPYKELFKVNSDGTFLEHSVVMGMLISLCYVLCYPIMHYFTKEHNCLLQLLIKPASPLIIFVWPVLAIIVIVKKVRDWFGPSTVSYYPETETKEVLVDEYGREEEIDGHCGNSVHTSSGWHDDNGDGTYS